MSEKKDVDLKRTMADQKLEAIKDTFNSYTDMNVKISEDKVKQNNTKNDNSTDDEISDSQIKAIANTYDAYTDIHLKTRESTDPIPKPKKIVFNIESMADLKPEVQEKIRRLTSIISEDKVRRLLKEIETEKELFSGPKGIFGKLTQTERQTLEKRLEEFKVPDEINRANIAAIVSCLDNIIVEID